ncbi:unnamed protein product [Cylicostephanus goldi]|uniref:Uncharacterized protein n=1 Tax=Cylicostephanus goldi TaxID=71465 RepID=A0A3P7MTJ2_CYLGO|nr:unnamed protein product [Cylicostephanus goldi]
MRGSTLSLMTRPSSLDAGTSAGSLVEKKSGSNLRSSVKDTNNNKRDPSHSTQALFLLAENLAELVDSVCKSDDKERLLPTLHAVWGNVVPYLKAKKYAIFSIFGFVSSVHRKCIFQRPKFEIFLGFIAVVGIHELV